MDVDRGKDAVNIPWPPLRLSSLIGLPLRIPWQTVVGFIFMVSGLALLGIALAMQAEKRDAEKSADTPISPATDLSNHADPSELHLTTSRLPMDRDHLQDVKRLFELAGESGVQMRQVDHEWMAGPERNLRLHMMTMRLREPYPDLRLFLDGISEVVPLASIHDLRIERRNVAAVEVDVTLQLLMLYRAAARPSNVE